MKFLFRNRKKNKEPAVALPSSSADLSLQDEYHSSGNFTSGSGGGKKARHRKGRQRKRRESLQDMEVPLARTSTATSITSNCSTSVIPITFSSSKNANNKTTSTMTTSTYKRPVQLSKSQSSSRSRVTNVTDTTGSTLSSTRSSSIYRISTNTATTYNSSIFSAISGANPSSFGGGHGTAIHMIRNQPWGSHRSLDSAGGCNETVPENILEEEEQAEDTTKTISETTQHDEDAAAIPMPVLELQQQSESQKSQSHSYNTTRERDTVTVRTGVSAISAISCSLPEDKDTVSSLGNERSPPGSTVATNPPVPSTAIITTTTAPLQFPTHHYKYLDTSTPDTVKDHAFQLVPNIHKEFGMLHRDFNSIQEATAYFLQHHLQQPLKPILSIDVELPGNLHAGRTIFSHPLIVEAIETFFVVVTTSHDTLPQDFHATVKGQPTLVATPTERCSKMRGNYVYTRVRILDPLTGCDLVPCVDDRPQHLSRAALLQAMMDALAMVCPEQPIPRYLNNLLEEERASTHAAALFHRRQDLNYYRNTTTNVIAEQQRRQPQEAPMAIFGLEHTALGEVIFAELEGVLSTQCGWVIRQLSSSSKVRLPPASSTDIDSKTHSDTHNMDQPERQAVVLVTYDPHRLSYCTLAKFAVQQHALQRLGRPSCLTFYYTSHEQQVAAQMHTRAHYRDLLAQVDPTNPAQHYYAMTGGSTAAAGNASPPTTHETIRIVPLQQRDHKGEPLHRNGRSGRNSPGANNSSSSSSASSTGSISEESLTGPPENRKNNSKNKTHPGYKVPNYDGVVAHAAAKAAAEAAAAKAPRYSFVLKTMCGASLQLQCSKPALRESHLRFVPLTPHQATRANQLVFQGKFHLAMKLLSPRQGMLLMHALRSGKPNRCVCFAHRTATPAVKETATPDNKTTTSAKTTTPKSTSAGSTPTKSTAATKSSASPNGKPRRASTKSIEGTSASGGNKEPVARKRRSSTAKPKPGSTTGARLRRASTTDTMPKKIFPKQSPRMSLNTEAMSESAKAAAASLRKSNDDNNTKTSAPPVETIDTSKPPSSGGEVAPLNHHHKTDIVYRDVVDVPILEAWKAFVVLPEGMSTGDDDDDDDDDSYMMLQEVYSHDEEEGEGRAYYTSDDAYSVGSYN